MKENIRQQLYSICSVIREVLYPRRCPVCGEIVLPKGRKICPECKEKLKIIKEPFCKKCSKPLEIEEQEYCFDCKKSNFSFVRGRALFLYDSLMKESIASFKFRGKKEYADFYTEEICSYLKEDILSMEPDVLIPVPVHVAKKRKRGYNQAGLLADGIGKLLNIPVVHDFLIRNKNTLPQKTLSSKERMKNLEAAFEINKNVLSIIKRCNKILIVDDIYTTGSTIQACTKVILDYGFKEVYFVSLCIGKGY